MTYQGDFTLPADLLEQIATQGFDVLPVFFSGTIDMPNVIFFVFFVPVM